MDTSAMTVYRILASFYGRTEFSRNQGGGVTLFSSRMDVRGEVILDHNTAIFGAGLALSGRSLVSLMIRMRLLCYIIVVVVIVVVAAAAAADTFK